jgi:ATP-dependent DNA ligase
VFNDLLFRRRECVFFAFDLLFLNGEELRALPLIERKVRLK